MSDGLIVSYKRKINLILYIINKKFMGKLKTEIMYAFLKLTYNIFERKKYFFEDFNLFWQYPVITEKTFYEQNKYNFNYLGLPWATIIDKKIYKYSDFNDSSPRQAQIILVVNIYNLEK